MYAHMSNNVLAATMGHLFLSQNESRFTFSHVFSLLPTVYLNAWFNDEPLHFKLKTLRTKQSDDHVDKRYAIPIRSPLSLVSSDVTKIARGYVLSRYTMAMGSSVV